MAAQSDQTINPKHLLKAQLQQLKLDAVIASVNHLLATKGFELMTVDEVAQRAGMSKASLYKIFDSKEALAGAAMVMVLDKALALVNSLRDNPDLTETDKLKAVTRWAMLTKLHGTMPSLPSHHSVLSEALKANQAYVERLFELSMKLSVWVAQAKQLGQIKTDLPDDFVLYTLYARACDPVLGVMKDAGQYSDEAIVQLMLKVFFDGLCVSNVMLPN
jgi:TetR/AcrR family transcriptional regulator, regulator of autoinduction and epiphytic fitness